MCKQLEDLGCNGLKILQDTNQYRFTSDSVLLANFFNAKKDDNVGELCSGSGVISILGTAKTNAKHFYCFEIQPQLAETLKAIKDLGVKCGVVINPDTPAEKIANVVELCDMILLMSVFPGFGGQKFIPDVLPKVKEVSALIEKSGKDIDLEIDGGITLENVKLTKDAGANVIVAGSTVFNASDRAKMIKDLREI